MVTCDQCGRRMEGRGMPPFTFTRDEVTYRVDVTCIEWPQPRGTFVPPDLCVECNARRVAAYACRPVKAADTTGE